MAVVNLNILKARFATGDRPTAKDFTDLIDTVLAGGAPGGGGGMTAGQSVFVGDTGSLTSKNSTDARAALGVLSAGTKAAGSADDQILKNHGAQVSGQPAVYDGVGWLTKTPEQFLALMGVGTKRAYFSSLGTAKGTPPLTTTLSITLTFTQPAGATHWTEIDLWGYTYLKVASSENGTSSIMFYWGTSTPVTISASEGAFAAMGCDGIGADGIYAIGSHFKGIVPPSLRETFPLVVTAKLVLINDKDGNNWNAAGVASAR